MNIILVPLLLFTAIGWYGIINGLGRFKDNGRILEALQSIWDWAGAGPYALFVVITTPLIALTGLAVVADAVRFLLWQIEWRIRFFYLGLGLRALRRQALKK